MQLQLKNGIITAVPAIHNRAVFADRVNQLCSDKWKIPKAIVVELGPGMTHFVKDWLVDLGTKRNRKSILPCMLGVTTTNNLIHPDCKDSLLDLQLHTVKRINNISPEILNQVYGYTDRTLVCLSPTDSIIEAIRCGIELEIPVFGIDMEVHANGLSNSVLFENSQLALSGVDDYIERNEEATGFVRDPYIDFRREFIMASQIKAVLSEFKNILYTGGIAHWYSLKKLLNDPNVLPAKIPGTSESRFKKVIVHPEIAIRSTDLFPVFSAIYEKRRQPAGKRSTGFQNIPNPAELYKQILSETIFKCGEDPAFQNKSLILIPEFERILIHFSMLGGKISPDWSDMLHVAYSMMPDEFCRILESCIMDIGQPWASNRTFPKLPVIEPSGNSNNAEISNKGRIATPTPDAQKQKGLDYHHSGSFYFQNIKEAAYANKSLKHWKWIDKPRGGKSDKYRFAWIWPPSECLLYGTALQAAKINPADKSKDKSVVFEGSLYEGIDVKKSMRSFITGDKKLYVRVSSGKESAIPDGKNPEPAVFIFEDNETIPKAHWDMFLGGSTIGNHVRDYNKFKLVTNQFGTCFVASIAYETDLPVPIEMNPMVRNYNSLAGITLFGNPCINSSQSAQWLEDTDYKCCPILETSTVANLQQKYREWFKISFWGYDWKNLLIMYAIPYCKEQLVVIAPDGFTPDPRITRECKARKTELTIIPLSFYPAEKIKTMRKRYSVRTNDANGFDFESDAEEIFGEKSDNHFNLLPPYMQNQLKKRK